MAGKKLKLAFITNDSARKASYKTRKKGLMKMVSKLSTLCGIEGCAVIYSPNEALPEVWPSHPEVQRLLSKFENLSEAERSKKMLNQESFLRERVSKTREQFIKQRRDNREKELTLAMFDNMSGNASLNLNIMDWNILGLLIDDILKDINKRIDTLIGASHSSKQPAAAASTEVVTSEATTEWTGRGSQERLGPENVDRIRGNNRSCLDLNEPIRPSGI